MHFAGDKKFFSLNDNFNNYYQKFIHKLIINLYHKCSITYANTREYKQYLFLKLAA